MPCVWPSRDTMERTVLLASISSRDAGSASITTSEPEKWTATSKGAMPSISVSEKMRSTASGPRNRVMRLRREWTASPLKIALIGWPSICSGERPIWSALLADTRDTSQSAVSAIRKPKGWTVPGTWIGSRSQLSRSTAKS